MNELHSKSMPDPEIMWQLWYEDTFDRETPRQIEAEGRGLVNGLIELWKRHLLDTVQVTGEQGFSRFNLWLPQQRRSIEILGGDAAALARLRRWVDGGRQRVQRSDAGADRSLLTRIARTHAHLISVGRSDEVILNAVADTRTREDFVTRLDAL